MAKKKRGRIRGRGGPGGPGFGHGGGGHPGPHGSGHGGGGGGGGGYGGGGRGRGRRGRPKTPRDQQPYSDNEPLENGEAGPTEPAVGVLELHPNGYGFLRDPKNNYQRERTDPFVPGTMIEKFALREGVLINGLI